MIRLNSLGWWIWAAIVFAIAAIAGVASGDWLWAALFAVGLVLTLGVAARLIRIASRGGGDGFVPRLPLSGRLARWLYRNTASGGE